jgi:hypothetical protein
MEARHVGAIGGSVRHDTSSEQYHQPKCVNRSEPSAD